MNRELLPITCPLCGKKNEFPIDALAEGSDFQCPSCKLKLKLHGHMWKEIESEIAKLKQQE